ncbi:hypothetical protein M8994_15555 [Brucella sp. 21LCYQ03]|nr:hypothetical protein [Brucella sp. 21LCYQ03]
MKYLPDLDTQLYLGQKFLLKFTADTADHVDEKLSLRITLGDAFSPAEDISKPRYFTKNGDNWEVTFSLFVNINETGYDNANDLTIYTNYGPGNVTTNSITYTKPIKKFATVDFTNENEVLFTTNHSSLPSDASKTVTATATVKDGLLPVAGYIVEWRAQTFKDENFFFDSVKTYLSNAANAAPLTMADLNPYGSIYQENEETVIRTVTDASGEAKLYMTANQTMGFTELSANANYRDINSVNEICVINPNAYPEIQRAPQLAGFKDGVLQLDDVLNPMNAYLAVPSTAETTDLVYAIVNGTYVYKNNPTDQHYINAPIYKTSIHTDAPNDFYYVLGNAQTGEVSLSEHLIFKAIGHPNVPPSDTPRDLPQPVGTSFINKNKIALSRKVPMACSLTSQPISDKWTAKEGDTITASVYIKGYEARTNINKNDSNTVAKVTLKKEDLTNPYISVYFDSSFFYGYGPNLSGKDSLAYFNYTVTPADDHQKTYTSKYHIASVDTVGPF